MSIRNFIKKGQKENLDFLDSIVENQFWNPDFALLLLSDEILVRQVGFKVHKSKSPVKPSSRKMIKFLFMMILRP